MIHVNDRLSIPDEELRFTASRGGGPGGQHVNKVASRVTLRFDVRSSPSLAAADRSRIEQKLASRISKHGILQLSSHSTRSQAANKAELTERFADLLQLALQRPRSRRPTRPTRGARERRLTDKKRRAEAKRRRARVRSIDE